MAREAGRITTGQAGFTTPVVLHGAFENPRNFLSSLAHVTLAEGSRRQSITPDDLIDDVLRNRIPVHRVLRWAETDSDEVGSLDSAQAVWVELAGGRADGVGSGLPFGHGPHRCPGAGIARRMALVLVDSLLAHPAPPEVLRAGRHVGPVTQGLRELHVRWSADPAPRSPRSSTGS